MLKKIAVSALLLACCSRFPASANQAPWGPVIGRTNQVVIEHRQYGEIHASIELYVLEASVSSLGYPVAGICDGAPDFYCQALFIPRTSSASCSWSTLPYQTRAALTFLIGGAWCGPAGHPVCLTTTGTYSWGESFVAESWSCSGGAHNAECRSMGGTLTPGLRIDSINSDSGCQF